VGPNPGDKKEEASAVVGEDMDGLAPVYIGFWGMKTSDEACEGRWGKANDGKGKKLKNEKKRK
jgi:hypothetical protein